MQQDQGESRRTFMKKSALTAAAVVAGPQIITHAEVEPTAREGVMGAGEHLYEWNNDWAKLPEGKRFGYTHAIREVADGRVFVHNQSEDAVAIFDPEGKLSPLGVRTTPAAHTAWTCAKRTAWSTCIWR